MSESNIKYTHFHNQNSFIFEFKIYVFRNNKIYQNSVNTNCMKRNANMYQLKWNSKFINVRTYTWKENSYHKTNGKFSLATVVQRGGRGDNANRTQKSCESTLKGRRRRHLTGGECVCATLQVIFDICAIFISIGKRWEKEFGMKYFCDTLTHDLIKYIISFKYICVCIKIA